VILRPLDEYTDHRGIVVPDAVKDSTYNDETIIHESNRLALGEVVSAARKGLSTKPKGAVHWVRGHAPDLEVGQRVVYPRAEATELPGGLVAVWYASCELVPETPAAWEHGGLRSV
jgi:hypothetical protein